MGRGKTGRPGATGNKYLLSEVVIITETDFEHYFYVGMACQKG